MAASVVIRIVVYNAKTDTISHMILIKLAMSARSATYQLTIKVMFSNLTAAASARRQTLRSASTAI